MRDGFIKGAAAAPEIRLADCHYNAQQLIQTMEEAAKQDVTLLTLPELAITGYTCGDLFGQRILQEAAVEALLQLVKASCGLHLITVVGLPLSKDYKMYNCAAVILDGQILGVIPKANLPNYGEFYEARQFTEAPTENSTITIGSQTVPFGPRLLFRCRELPELCIGVEICEDIWVPSPPSLDYGAAGATLICNLSASDEVVGKAEFRRQMLAAHSAQLLCGYLYADAGSGESSTDLVFSGHQLLYENGLLLKEAPPFSGQMAVGDFDLQRITAYRQRMSTYPLEPNAKHQMIEFSLPLRQTKLERNFSPEPFISHDPNTKFSRCQTIIDIQAMGLKRRLEHLGNPTPVLGISGGLDSTLALLATVRTMTLMGRSPKEIMAITMPCFGTSERTLQNAQALCEKLEVPLRTVDITGAVERHLEDIGHNGIKHDITYENAQARERTQVLMDIANQVGGIVIGTGDLSELALGWTTYNGDHMSMYGINASIPKTLLWYLVTHWAHTSPNLKEVLENILATPVSPELLPAGADGQITQVTEDLVGPYRLHDFFLYYVLRFGFRPSKIYRLARLAFKGTFEDKVILRWLKVFYSRFFSQQFKRSCLPDGPKVGSVTLSPRGDWRMPSDASAALWLREVEEIPTP